jgi:hypothetical protein
VAAALRCRPYAPPLTLTLQRTRERCFKFQFEDMRNVVKFPSLCADLSLSLSCLPLRSHHRPHSWQPTRVGHFSWEWLAKSYPGDFLQSRCFSYLVICLIPNFAAARLYKSRMPPSSLLALDQFRFLPLVYAWFTTRPGLRPLLPKFHCHACIIIQDVLSTSIQSPYCEGPAKKVSLWNSDIRVWKAKQPRRTCKLLSGLTRPHAPLPG